MIRPALFYNFCNRSFLILLNDPNQARGSITNTLHFMVLLIIRARKWVRLYDGSSAIVTVVKKITRSFRFGWIFPLRIVVLLYISGLKLNLPGGCWR